MTKIPRISGKEMLHFLQHRGFRIVRIRGSHYFLESNSKRTCVPVHGMRSLKIGTLSGILRDIHLSPAEFTNKLKN